MLMITRINKGVNRRT